MSVRSPVQPALLSKMNERQVLRTLLRGGPLSRAGLARITGLTPPTVSKAVDSLLGAGYLDEHEPDPAFGRPARKVGLATRHSQVLGLVIDAHWCRLVAAGLDGRITAAREFPTPERYALLIDRASSAARDLSAATGITSLGVGISVPGLVDYREQQCLLSPNVPITNGQFVGRDLEQSLGIQCVLAQEEHALCLAERCFGDAAGLEDFAMLDVSTGVGLGVISAGRLLTGQSGLAGEIGHVTVDLHGRKCGCGNRGCLETVACDSALAWQVSRRLGRGATIEEVLSLARRGELSLEAELESLCDYLAVAFAAVINLFNPAVLFVFGRVFRLEEALFERTVQLARQRALPPAFAQCRIVQARGSKRQGALAAIIEHRIESLVPAGAPPLSGCWSTAAGRGPQGAAG